MIHQQRELRTIIENACKCSAPSLKRLCVIRCATELCNLDTVRNLLECLKYPETPESRLSVKSQIEWQELNAIIVDKLNSILIPITLKEKIFSYIFPIALEILQWIAIYQNYELPEEFCWTVLGTIDFKKTTIKMIKNESVCIQKRFILSCIYCIDTAIILLWIDMPFEDKNYFIDEVRDPIIFYWVIKICAPREKAMLFNIDLLFQSAFHHAVLMGNLDAVKYFTYRLHPDARQRVLEEIFDNTVRIEQEYPHCRIPGAKEADTWFFLFVHMTMDRQSKYIEIRESLEVIFYMFIVSGRQKHLSSLMNIVSPYMKRYHYSSIGFQLIQKYLMEYKDCNYRKIFMQFWSCIPNDMRTFLREEHFGAISLANLIKYYFSFILDKGTMESKGKMISRYLKLHKLWYHNFFNRHKWKLVLFLIRNQVVTLTEVKHFKKGFLRTLGFCERHKIIWKRALRFIRVIENKSCRQLCQLLES